MISDSYKDGFNDTDLDEKERSNFKTLASNSSEEDYEQQSENSEEEETMNEYVHRMLSEISDYLAQDPNHKLASSSLSTLSGELMKPFELDINPEDLNFLAQIACSIGTPTVNKYALACMSSIIKKIPETVQFLIETNFLESLRENIDQTQLLQTCDQLYDFLTAFAKTQSNEQLFTLFSIPLLFTFSSNEDFVFPKSFFDYLTCLVNSIQHDSSEEESKLLESILIHAFRTKNEHILSNVYEFAIEMAKKHLINPNIWSELNSYIRTWNPPALKGFFQFVSTMALEGCFFINIDLSFVFEIMKEFNDNKLLSECILMLCCLLENEEFYDTLLSSLPDILEYAYEHSNEGNYDHKSLFVQLLATYLKEYNPKREITDFDISCLKSVIEFMNCHQFNDLLTYILESLCHFMNTIRMSNYDLFTKIKDGDIDHQLIEELEDSEDDSISKQATIFLEILHQE